MKSLFRLLVRPLVRLLSAVGLLIGITSLPSCGNRNLQAGSYQEADLDGFAKVRLPAQLRRIRSTFPKLAGSGKFQVEILGDVAADLLDMNLWSVNHAFGFQGKTDTAILIISRVSDQQAFAPAQLYYDAAVRIAGDARWSTGKRLDWTQRTVSNALSFQEARLDDSIVIVMSDRETLLQAILIGEKKVVTPEVARAILEEARRSYKLMRPLDGYFYQITKTVQRLAEGRRKNYLALLQVLQREELDYSPTPKVVVFNSDLACQFFWPMFDRSGVPSEFAIVGRLGRTKTLGPEEWRRVEDGTAKFHGMHIFSVASGLEGKWTPTPLVGPGEQHRLAASVVQDTNWIAGPDLGLGVAFASLEFSFTDAIPDLSKWLDTIEVIEKLAHLKNAIEVD